MKPWVMCLMPVGVRICDALDEKNMTTRELFEQLGVIKNGVDRAIRVLHRKDCVRIVGLGPPRGRGKRGYVWGPV